MTQSPTLPSQRIGSLDFLRGIAVLGILIINVESFAYPDPWSPFKYGFADAVDQTTRFWVYFLAQGKFFSMFALLFGAGFYIFLERLASKGLGIEVLDLYARRLLWLFVFGLIHAYLIWDGDILYHYAVCGFFLIPFRSLGTKRIALTMLILSGALLYGTYRKTLATQNQYLKYTKISQLEASERTKEDNQQLEGWENRTRRQEADRSAVAVPRQSLYQSWVANATHTRVHQGVVLYRGILFRTLMMMLLGILLYRSDVFRDYQIVKHYWLITLAVLAFALVANYARYYHWTYAYFQPVRDVWQAGLFTFPKELLGLAYVLLLNGLYQKYYSRVSFRSITNVGRMALTNYVFQSVVCGLIFYGYGLGKYNQYSRVELLVVVAIIWVVQIALSRLWMRRFSYGPLEGIWRRLTYQTVR